MNRHGFKGYSAKNQVLCKVCKSVMKEIVDGQYECTNPACYNKRFRRSDGSLENLDDRFSGRTGICHNCHGSLNGSTKVEPWEDGNNSRAYILCQHCGHRNY